MRQHMMIRLIIIERAFLAGNPGTNHVRNHAQSIGVRQNARPRHQLAIARVVRGCHGNQPASDEMRQWGHGSGRKFFAVRQMVAIPTTQGIVAGVCKQKWQRRRFDVAVAKDHVGFASVAQHIYIPTYSKGVAFPFLTRAFGILFPIKRF